MTQYAKGKQAKFCSVLPFWICRNQMPRSRCVGHLERVFILRESFNLTESEIYQLRVICNPVSNKLGYEPKLVGYIDQADRYVFLKEENNSTTFYSPTNTWHPSTDMFDRAEM